MSINFNKIYNNNYCLHYKCYHKSQSLNLENEKVSVTIREF